MKINSAEFVVSNSDYRSCPNSKICEFAFIGRSNVGKSSLINMLLQSKDLAKTSSKPGKTLLINHFLVNRNWYVIDAKDIPLGRVASKAATILRGKHKVTYTPHVDCGDYVIIINASKVRLTGRKMDNKMYYNHSGYTGGLRERNAREMVEKYPVEMVERAVKGMLPKGPLGSQMYRKLFVYAGAEHEQQAQKPETITL